MAFYFYIITGYISHKLKKQTKNYKHIYAVMWYSENNKVKKFGSGVTLGDTKLGATVFHRLTILATNQAVNVIYHKILPTLQLRKLEQK